MFCWGVSLSLSEDDETSTTNVSHILSVDGHNVPFVRLLLFFFRPLFSAPFAPLPGAMLRCFIGNWKKVRNHMNGALSYRHVMRKSCIAWLAAATLSQSHIV